MSGYTTKPLKTKRSVHNMLFRLTICVQYMLICKYDSNLLTTIYEIIFQICHHGEKIMTRCRGKKIGRELLKGIDFTGVRVAILVNLF